MAVPKRRVCHSRKKMRQSHQALKVPAMSIDRQTKSVHRPHHVDLRTGLYRGRQVLFREEETAGPTGDKPDGGDSTKTT
ncbi:MAG: 50S ribosomal protein L32 [Planctomycetes bacterium]|nr:50S ribosomal protein L32 [Planctomycetota bacterium]